MADQETFSESVRPKDAEQARSVLACISNYSTYWADEIGSPKLWGSPTATCSNVITSPLALQRTAVGSV